MEQARGCWRQLLARVPRTPCARRGGHGPEMRASTACGRACGVSCAGQPDTRPRRVHAADQGGAGAGGQWPPLCVSRRPFGHVARAHSVFWRIRGWRRARSLTQLRRSAGAPRRLRCFPCGTLQTTCCLWNAAASRRGRQLQPGGAGRARARRVCSRITTTDERVRGLFCVLAGTGGSYG